ncbi:MrcB family domain-containing protein [Nocardia sp. bgisy134]|uniref:MrcB family domain-containing protein n=1 Tax=Nocardia sp. bgisy134 TaxID=3413789 RepID=UPI003D72A4E4
MLGDGLDEVLKLQAHRTAALADLSMQRRTAIVEREIPQLLEPWVAAVFPTWSAEGSGGKGSASEVPWSRYFDPELSPSATVGWYVVYLFSATGDAVYLSLNQGTTTWSTAIKDFVHRRPADLLRRVEWARSVLAADKAELGEFEDVTDLGRNRLARGYEFGNVHAIRYAVGEIPPDEKLRADFVEIGKLLGKLYAADAATAYLPGDEPPEIADADHAVEEAAGNARHRPKSGQGYRLNTAEKLVIEKHAVAVVREHFEDSGYKVRDTGATKPYDLLATKEGETVYVEVKGTTSPGDEVILTRGEVEHHREHYPNNALAVLHSIHLDRNGLSPIASGGILAVTHEWKIEDDALTPISFRYEVPKSSLPTDTE